jgi:tetratricopeptide (TPR) repeat protein
MERPDSALTVLESIDRVDLNTARTKAHHALLHAMALDKNFIDVSDDSIARVAVDYFSKHGPQKYHARSLYYLGLAYYYQKDYNKAIIEFTRAEEVAEGCDSLYLSLILTSEADAYSRNFSHVEELNSLRRAYMIDQNLNSEYYINVTKLRLVQSLYNLHYNDEANSMLNELLCSDISNGLLKASVNLTHAFVSSSLSETPDFKLASNIYEEIYSSEFVTCMTIRDYWAWAYSLNALGRKDESQELINQLILEQSGTSSYWQYMIAKSDGNLKMALSYLEDYIKYNDKEVSDALKQSLALSQRDYYSSQSELSKSRARIARLTSLFILLIAIFSALLACILIRSYVKRQEHQKEKYLLYISEINRQLDEARKEDYPALKKKYLSLYKTRFETIGSLSEQYIQAEGRSDIESLMFKKVVTLIKEIKNDSTNRAKFEAMLDEDLDMIMTNLRKEMPKFSETDYSIFSYLVVGFDATTISRLLDISVNNIYVHKHRIRTRIEERHPEHASQFLEMLT